MNGGEHREGLTIKSSIRDVRNSLYIDPRRSGAVYTEFCKVYNGIDTVSEVSWTIVSRNSGRRVHSNSMINKDYVVGLVDGVGKYNYSVF